MLAHAISTETQDRKEVPSGRLIQKAPEAAARRPQLSLNEGLVRFGINKQAEHFHADPERANNGPRNTDRPDLTSASRQQVKPIRRAQAHWDILILRLEQQPDGRSQDLTGLDCTAVYTSSRKIDSPGQPFNLDCP
ncbi:MAG: hypothetical protein FRX49_02702 [Trebouxia sp. A1-2]|nr:MAG: hypothetical protein FRX49_02702 [Trebouxia sp. A1-2]